MLPQYESFLDATPEKGVIIVEYWWQSPNRMNAAHKRPHAEVPVGIKTSMVFFKRILAADKCWCGSGKTFSKCHRRDDDWSYVSLDPDRRQYSPVVLLERRFADVNSSHARHQLAQDKRLLCTDFGRERAEWAFPGHPPIVNDIGQLVLGSIEVTAHGLRVETNSERRLEHITRALNHLLGANLENGDTRRAEPQKTFAVPHRR